MPAQRLQKWKAPSRAYCRAEWHRWSSGPAEEMHESRVPSLVALVSETITVACAV